MINKETIISAFDEKLTLLQWLKKIEKALIDGILKNVKVVKVDDAHVKFAFEFSDGTTQETNEIVLAETDVFTLSALIEGSESVVVDINESNTALEIHLDVDLINRINNSLQLPLARPTEQVLVGVDTTNAENLLKLGEGLQIENEKLRVGGVVRANEIIENMTGYSFNNDYLGTTYEINPTFAGVVKTGNKLTLSIAFTIKRVSENVDNYFPNIGYFVMPTSVVSKLVPAIDNLLETKPITLVTSATDTNAIQKYALVEKTSHTNVYITLGRPHDLTLNQLYYSRVEATFLLSDNLAQEIGDLD